jgi:toxin FitB
MTTWLMDTALFNTLASPKATSLRNWLEANDASVFLSAASLTEIAASIGKMSANRWQRGDALRTWFDEIITRFADRIHPVDAAIATRAGALLPSRTNGHLRHRFHDALLVATAQIHGHGLITRRDDTFGPWTQTPIAIV